MQDPKAHMIRKATPILSSALLLGVVFNWFFVDKLPGISVVLFTALILSLTAALAWQFRAWLNSTVYALAPVAVFFSFMVFVRANQFLAFVNVLAIIYLLSLVAKLAGRHSARLRDFDVLDYLHVPQRLAAGLIRAFNGFWTEMGKHRKADTRWSGYVPVLRGIAYALPILVVFLLLLSSADLVFGKFITSLFHPDISPELIPRIGLIGIITSLFVGAFAYIYLPTLAGAEPVPRDAKRSLGTTESSIILGSVAVLFFIFVLIQSAYLFGGADHITSTGYTYAQYARKGFFELIAVAVISLLLVGAIRKLTLFRTMGQTMAFKWLSGVLALEVLVIMFSAHKRLGLYEDAYGFTTLRLLSHLFIGWLAYAFGQLLYHIVRDKRDSSYAFQLFVSALCFLALVNVINPDRFIARRNIQRFNATGKIDTAYLKDLSEDAIPAIAQLLTAGDRDVQREAASLLYLQERKMIDQPDDWMAANLGRQRARDVVHSKQKQIETLRH
jgi:hypothetical protein